MSSPSLSASNSSYGSSNTSERELKPGHMEQQALSYDKRPIQTHKEKDKETTTNRADGSSSSSSSRTSNTISHSKGQDNRQAATHSHSSTSPSSSSSNLNKSLVVGSGPNEANKGNAATATITSSSDTKSSSVPSSSSLKSAAVFAAIKRRINKTTVSKVKAVYRFDISPDESNGSGSGGTKHWLIDLKEGEGKVQECESSSSADCVVIMKDSDFVSLMSGKLNPQTAFMKGKLKVKGNIMLAQKLSALMPSKKPTQTQRDGETQDDKKEERKQSETTQQRSKL